MLSDPRFRIPLVFVLAVVAHTSVMPRFRVFGVMPDVLLLVAVAGGLVGGPGRGAVMGFVAGILADLFLTTPLGLSALAFCLVGYAIGSTAESLMQPERWFTMVATAVGSAAGIGLFAVIGAMLGVGDLLGSHLLAIMAVVGLINGILGLAATRLVRWATSESESHRRDRRDRRSLGAR